MKTVSRHIVDPGLALTRLFSPSVGRVLSAHSGLSPPDVRPLPLPVGYFRPHGAFPASRRASPPAAGSFLPTLGHFRRQSGIPGCLRRLSESLHAAALGKAVYCHARKLCYITGVGRTVTVVRPLCDSYKLQSPSPRQCWGEGGDIWHEMHLLDFLAGWVAGGLATAVGYPLDTIKVRIQTQHMYNGVWHCIQSTYQREKVYGFYKGMALPVLSVSVCGSVCFGTYRNCLHFLSQLRHGSSDVKPARLDVFIAGCSAGTAEAMVFAPVDLVKIRQQNQTHPHQTYQGPPSRGLSSKPKYRGPIHCLITVIKEEGILGLYRGITALWLRDIPCFGLYFLVYSIFTEWLTPQGQHKPDWSAMLLAGGCAGMTYWTLATPMDVMKSRMQMDGMGQQRYSGVLNCITESFRQEGTRVFFKGLSLNCVRAFPVNGLTFVIYETVLAFLKKINLKD